MIIFRLKTLKQTLKYELPVCVLFQAYVQLVRVHTHLMPEALLGMLIMYEQSFAPLLGSIWHWCVWVVEPSLFSVLVIAFFWLAETTAVLPKEVKDSTTFML